MLNIIFNDVNSKTSWAFKLYQITHSELNSSILTGKCVLTSVITHNLEFDRSFKAFKVSTEQKKDPCKANF